VIVVFTDGSDNSSTLTTAAAILRAKTAGVPVYTIAQGEALDAPELLKQLASVSARYRRRILRDSESGRDRQGVRARFAESDAWVFAGVPARARRRITNGGRSM